MQVIDKKKYSNITYDLGCFPARDIYMIFGEQQSVAKFTDFEKQV